MAIKLKTWMTNTSVRLCLSSFALTFSMSGLSVKSQDSIARPLDEALQRIDGTLPDESILPNSYRSGGTKMPLVTPLDEQAVTEVAKERQRPSDLQLPSESVLASAMPLLPDSAAKTNSAQKMPTIQLPGETVLATDKINNLVVAQETAADDTQGGVGGKQGGDVADSDVSPGETRPWLRLNYFGHTERIRALSVSEDGQWAVSGGEDKVLHVWQRTMERGWIHRRAIRWQVERGPRGRIYRVAVRGKYAALAGHGALGGLGEIWIVDITSGELQRALVDGDNGHLQTVAQLAWAPGDDAVLASADVQGKMLVWRADAASGLWAGRVLVNEDIKTYGADLGKKLEPLRMFVSFAFAGPQHLIVPRFGGVSQQPPKPPQAIWRLERLAIDGSSKSTIGESEHLGLVVTMAGSRDGRRIASADETGRVRIWTLSPDAVVRVGELKRASTDGQPLDIGMDASGQRILIGYSTPDGGGIEVWQTDVNGAAPTRTGQLKMQGSVLACDFANATGNDGVSEVLIAIGSEVHVHGVDRDGKLSAVATQRLNTSVRPVKRVAFAKVSDGYELALGYGESWDDTFNVTTIQIGRDAAIDANRFRAAQTGSEAWSVRPEMTPLGQRYRLFLGDQPRALLPLEPQTHGVPTAIAEIKKTDDPVANESNDLNIGALAVGSTSRGNIYIYEMPSQKSDESPRLLRQFRGHTGSVSSLSVSADGRYLASGSDDATVGLWPLSDIFQSDGIANRWGIDLDVNPGGLEVAQIRQDGPLFFRGVREGDRLVRIRWPDKAVKGNINTFDDPEAMRKALAETAFDTLVVFEWERRGERLPGFQSFPAWQPLAQLFVDRDREWAIWTPAGIYDASVNGHQRFGWQVNRGVERLPDFFRADQFRQRLERPDVLKRLLDRGSLASALAANDGAVAPVGESAIVNQLRASPHIEWLSPESGTQVDSDRLVIEAKIRLPLGATLAKPKVYADGVAASAGVVLKSEAIANERIETYRWTVPLVSRSEILLEILAATEAGSWDHATRTVRRVIDPNLPIRKPRLHLLAVGVGQYRDPQIQSLDFAVRGATEIYQTLSKRTSPLYQFDGVKLLDQDVVRPLWNAYSQEAMRRLASEVQADDLVVMYLCGHGLRDRSTGRWYFVTADARHSDLMNDRYSDCLAFEDLAALSSLPCRKLAILDSCHSGAVQPVMQTGDLKSALRWLQEDRILTLTASEGHEEAAEQKNAGLGRFTARLIEAIDGEADLAGNRDGVVSLNETYEFIRKSLEEDSRRDGFIQRPTAGPMDLMQSIHIPLTATIAKPESR